MSRVDEGGAAPRFCPSCRRARSSGRALCDHCGERLVDQGYCATCEGYWKLPEGAACPKHELPLDAPPRVDTDPALEGDDPRWTTVARFADAFKAQAPRIRLEAEGIPTFLDGERMGSRSMYPVATGGVALQVPMTLSAEARVVLSQTWAPVEADEDDLETAWDDLAPDPGAGRRRVMRAAVLAFLLGPFALTLVLRGWRLLQEWTRLLP